MGNRVMIWFEDQGNDKMAMGCDSAKVNTLLAGGADAQNAQVPLTGAEFCAMTAVMAVKRGLEQVRSMRQARNK